VPKFWPFRTATPTTESAGPQVAGVPAPRGFAYGIPPGGTTEYNQGSIGVTGDDRRTALEELYQVYLMCPWASACTDVVARTITAGGIDVVWDGGDEDETEAPEAPPNVVALRSLLSFVNPNEDIRQLMRGVIVDLEVFADAFIEVVWLAGQPVALYSLDVPSMSIISDEHGVVTQYLQITESGQRATFEPHEVIHISLDVTRSGLYGVSPTQKALLPITVWLFTAATLKEVMRKGDPANIHADMPKEMQDNDIKKWRQQYMTQNVGPRNIGTPITTKGGATVTELKVYAVENYIKGKDQARDEILSTYGVPPSKVGIIESGNLGGGTGTSQDKTFRVNTCGPVGEAVMEKLVYHLAVLGFGIIDWTMRFVEIDWRDDKTVDDIADTRVRSGRWTLNRARAEIGEAAVDGGDEAVIIDRTNLVLWKDLAAMSLAQVEKNAAPMVSAKRGAGAQPPSDGEPGDVGGDGAKESAPARDAKRLREAWDRSYRDQYDRVLAETAPRRTSHAAHNNAIREAAEARTGAFVILRVTPDQAADLAVAGGEPAGNLHITLAYLDRAATDYTDAVRTEIQDALTEYWAEAEHPITTDTIGIAQFNPNSGEDDDVQSCAVLLVQSPALLALRQAVERIVEGMESDKYPIWIPHVTLGYGLTTDDIADRAVEISFDQLEVVWGDDSVQI
jgi:2'-5' RNA ligase